MARTRSHHANASRPRGLRHLRDLPARRGRALPCQGGHDGISTIEPCRPVPSELLVRVFWCQRALGSGGWCAPEILRSRGGRSAISSTWRSPITPSAGGNVSTFPPPVGLDAPAPGLLWPSSTRDAKAPSRRPGIARSRRGRRATSPSQPPPIIPRLPSGHAVIALREVDGMAPRTLPPSGAPSRHRASPAIPETCVPGEGGLAPYPVE